MDFSEKYSMQDIMDIAKVSRATIYNHLEKLNEIGATKMMNNKRVFSERAIEFLKGEDKPVKPVLGKIVNKEEKNRVYQKKKIVLNLLIVFKNRCFIISQKLKEKKSKFLLKTESLC